MTALDWLRQRRALVDCIDRLSAEVDILAARNARMAELLAQRPAPCRCQTTPARVRQETQVRRDLGALGELADPSAADADLIRHLALTRRAARTRVGL